MNPNLVFVLIDLADKYADGHLTIMKFTTNWRICFSTPNCQNGFGLPILREKSDECFDDCYRAIKAMFEGKTFEEAARKAILGLCDKKFYAVDRKSQKPIKDKFIKDHPRLFIVSPDIETYMNYVKKHNLNPCKVWYCESEEIADKDVCINRKQGLIAEKLIIN